MAIENFWETEYKFGMFLKKIFEDKYKRKYSLEGNGIYNLLYLNGSVYEIKYGKTTSMLKADNHAGTVDKNFIMNTIVNNLSCEVIVNGGKFITFPVKNWIAKVEIIKKVKEPK